MIQIVVLESLFLEGMRPNGISGDSVSYKLKKNREDYFI